MVGNYFCGYNEMTHIIDNKKSSHFISICEWLIDAFNERAMLLLLLLLVLQQLLQFNVCI